MSYEEYLKLCNEGTLPAGQRIGQYYFNTLQQVRPDLAEKVRETDRDPFYDNRRIPAFHTFVEWMWETTP